MAEQAGAVRDVVVVGGGAAGLSAALTLARARRAVTVGAVVAGAISRLEINSGRVSGVRLDDGKVVAVDVVVVSPRMVARTALFAGIGIAPTSHPAGAFIESDAFGKTAVPGVWVAGNASDISAQVSGAAAEGARAAQHINADLVMEDLDRAVAALADALPMRRSLDDALVRQGVLGPGLARRSRRVHGRQSAQPAPDARGQ